MFTKKIIFINLLLLISFCFLEASGVKCEIHDIVVYVINLDRSPERMKKIKSLLDTLGIKFTRFPAIDGYNIKIVNLKTNKIEDNKSFHKVCDKNSDYLISCGLFSFKYTTTPKIRRLLCCGELGCALSHLSIAKDIVQKGHKLAMILEDDVVCEKDFKVIFAETLKNTPKDMGILFLDIGLGRSDSSPYFVSPGALLDSFRQIPGNKYVVRLKENFGVYGLHAYALTLDGAREILKNSRIITLPIDNHIISGPAMPNSKKYVARKKMLSLSDEISEIHKMGRNFCVTSKGIIVSKVKQ
ncbi:MAG: glycosyltransferase family 25 protein [Holosporaceae bacterium]|jgi:GR25 family glycosyltransferase involved in LPS biosynthesis|nr:glycosyltransferase family 25 protein [Holosporaceae bacterium]